MKKLILLGRSECGKTTLAQALCGDVIAYQKTQYVKHEDIIIDTPGEYAESTMFSSILSLYTYEASVVALLLSATERYSVYSPCFATRCNRPVIGIVTQIDHPKAFPKRAHSWLELAGCHPIFHVSSYTGEGLWQILNYIREPGDVLPWNSKEEMERPRTVLSDKYGEK